MDNPQDHVPLTTEEAERIWAKAEDEMLGEDFAWGPKDVEPFTTLPEAPELAFDEEQWWARGTELAKRENDVKWDLGDWLVVGARHFGEDPPSRAEVIKGVRLPVAPDVYSKAELITGLSRATLKDLASTARRCPSSVRTDGLSWSHHRVLINARPDNSEDQLREHLKRAAEKNLTVAQFKSELTAKPFTPAIKEKSFIVTVGLDVWEALKDFADEEQSSVQVVAAEWLANALLDDTMQSRRALAKRMVQDRRYEQRKKSGQRLARAYPLKERG